MNFGQPDPQRAVLNYRALAPQYDTACTRISSIREETIALLGLRRGDRVLVVASGTGLSFPYLRAAVGDNGSVTDIELSPDMCELARQRIQRAGWHNASVAEGNALSSDQKSRRPVNSDSRLENG